MTPLEPMTPAESWVEHLRAGGTTPWRRWVREAVVPAGQVARAADHDVPGAAQLELLRRLNRVGPMSHRADHVLGRSGPGRGPVHLALPLESPGRPAPRREVLRVAAGVLADLTAQLPPPSVGRRRRWRERARPATGFPSFVLEGPPLTVAEVRAGLAAAGMPEHQPGFSWLGGARPRPGPEVAVVLVAPLDEALRQVWSSRVQRGAGRAWSTFVAQWAGPGLLPPSAAVDRIADDWAGRLGADNVHLVPIAGPGDSGADAAAQVAQVAQVLGRPSVAAPGGAAPVLPSDPVRLPAAVVDVLRRVNVVLPFVCPPADLPARLATLVRLAREVEGRLEPVDLPERHRGWADTTASGLVDALLESGCARHGDLEALRTTGPATGRTLAGGEVLDAMVRMIHRVDAALVEAARDGRRRR